jgi:ABC-type bacteriocin/lantibiotic exporter with double-glycine peptidase domain
MKKVALGWALLRHAKIVFFDEPLEHLDNYGQQVVNEMLSDAQKTRIYIQHRDSHAFTAMKLIQL